MKNLSFFLLVSLGLLFGCSKDLLNSENPDLKKANVPIPMKGAMCMTEDINVPRLPVANTPVVDPSSGKVLIPQLTLSGAAFLSGHSTQLGEFDSARSYMTGRDAFLDLAILFSEHKVVIKATYDVLLTAANGDCVSLISYIRIDATDPNRRIITADWKGNGGSGNFENITGSGTLSGVIPCWDFDGTMEYPR